MTAGEPDRLIETEYQERWEYVRHTETIRYRIVYWFFGLTGILLGFAYLKVPEVQDPVFGLSSTAVAAVILGFLTLYGLFTSGFLVGQKLNYRRQRERTDEIERGVLGPDAGDVVESSPSIGFGVFAFYYYAVSLTVGGLLALFLLTLGTSIAGAVIPGILLAAMVACHQWIRRQLLEMELRDDSQASSGDAEAVRFDRGGS